jgi:glycoprotein endo-alpha-1,2-mannosidase
MSDIKQDNNLMRDLLLGTWNYTVKEAPFGFRTGKVIFFEEDGQVKAKLKIYGLTIKTKDLIISGTKVSFNAQVDIEQVALRLELDGDRLMGLVHMSEGAMAVEMTKKDSQKTETLVESDRSTDNSPGATNSQEFAQRKSAQKDLCKQIDSGVRIHTFYYGWYGNPEFDGETKSWNDPVIPHWIETTWNDAPPRSGCDDVSSNFYPQLGCYSTSNPEVINTHMRQIRDAGIGVVVLSWWGKEHFTDKSVPTILDTAHNYGLKVVFHLEPFFSTVNQFRTQLEYISEKYNQHPAIYRFNGLPLYYLYNSFKLGHHEWLSMMSPESKATIRKTALDGVFISLWTTQFDGEFTVRSGFDGFYTYYASDGFSYGSTTSNWLHLSQFARQNDLIYIPCVGPGYMDTRLRPWNEKTTKSRDNGRYYEAMMKKAIETNPDFIGITSFNEWFEGTQIEPAVPKAIPSYTYEDYGKDTEPLFYIKKTKELISKYVKLNHIRSR